MHWQLVVAAASANKRVSAGMRVGGAPVAVRP